MKRFLTIVSKLSGTILLLALFLVIITGISPIFDFERPQPFSGPDVFNPYRNLDTSISFRRANFHTHTRVAGPLNECDYGPEEASERYRDFGCEIVTVSNHNHLDGKVYEHGWNLLKFHKLVFGAPRVIFYDNLLPLLASQRQFQLDLLGRDAVLIQFNHPLRTMATTRNTMEKLSGYKITELDSGISTEQEYWDWALSAGHYSFALANDDLHHPERSGCIAVRNNFLNCRDTSHEEVIRTLLDGAYYCMRIPDYGDGDWAEKIRKNGELPSVRSIGAKSDTLSVELSTCAEYIKVTGQNHVCLDSLAHTRRLKYVLPEDEPYARITAYFNDGAVIYTNPFARYDKTKAESPFADSPHSVNIPLTILYNLSLLILAAACILLGIWLWSDKKLKS